MIHFKVDKKAEAVTFRTTLKFESWFLTLQVTKLLYYNNEATLGEQDFETVFYWPESKYRDHGYLKQWILDNNYLYQSGKNYEVQFEAVMVEKDRNHKHIVRVFNESDWENYWEVLVPPCDSGTRLDYLVEEGKSFRYRYNCTEGQYEGIPLRITDGEIQDYPYVPIRQGFFDWVRETKEEIPVVEEEPNLFYPFTLRPDGFYFAGDFLYSKAAFNGAEYYNPVRRLFPIPETSLWTIVKGWAPPAEPKKKKKEKKTELTPRQKNLIKELKEFIIPGGTPADYEERMAAVSPYTIIWNLFVHKPEHEYSGNDYKTIFNHLTGIVEKDKPAIVLPFEETKFYYTRSERTDIDTRFQIIKIEKKANGEIWRIQGHHADKKYFDKEGKEVLFPIEPTYLIPETK